MSPIGYPGSPWSPWFLYHQNHPIAHRQPIDPLPWLVSTFVALPRSTAQLRGKKLWRRASDEDVAPLAHQFAIMKGCLASRSSKGSNSSSNSSSYSSPVARRMGNSLFNPKKSERLMRSQHWKSIEKAEPASLAAFSEGSSGLPYREIYFAIIKKL